MTDTQQLAEASLNRDLRTDSVEITHYRPAKPAVVSTSRGLLSYERHETFTTFFLTTDI